MSPAGLLMMVLEKLVGVEKSEVVSWVSDAMEKLESSLLALMGVAQLKININTGLTREVSLRGKDHYSLPPCTN